MTRKQVGLAVGWAICFVLGSLITVVAYFILVPSYQARIRPVNPPLISLFGDGTQWMVWTPILFSVELDIGQTATIRVPRGFVTDLASTPRIFWSAYPPFGKYLAASVLHDYLYWTQLCKRDEADKILYQTMKDAGVDEATQSRFYVALKTGGQAAWDQNKKDKDGGMVRVVPTDFLSDARALDTMSKDWGVLRADLKAKGITEEVVDRPPDAEHLCESLGGEIKVRTDLQALLFGR